jgi:hypothetical protein
MCYTELNSKESVSIGRFLTNSYRASLISRYVVASYIVVAVNLGVSAKTLQSNLSVQD